MVQEKLGDASQNEVKLMITNIATALEIISVDELSASIIHVLARKKPNLQNEISTILKVVADDYSITVSYLKSKNVRGDAKDAKQIAFCLLHFTLGLSVRDIANKIFHCWPNSVQIGISRLKKVNEKVLIDRQFSEKYNYLRTNFIKSQTEK